ncbi:hypothetical protein SAY87_005657 [Trapa incisa]|uniref:Uncharacterized protein n=1 Tax=Trapa incisa TaxID=236973 RepID=A0AAN7K6H1_9MYRT|nr:hypothetical protein SAY87_005657 [Trapa incisa]
MAGTCCPIEMEPRTLRQGQLNLAREVAANVVQKMPANEASGIFTEGMEPVVLPMMEVKVLSSTVEIKASGGKPPLDGAMETTTKTVPSLLEKPCQCLCRDVTGNPLADSPDNYYVDGPKEPLSAPF